jgi:hypothetical protein
MSTVVDSDLCSSTANGMPCCVSMAAWLCEHATGLPYMHNAYYVCVCVFVCVRERERKGMRERVSIFIMLKLLCF